MNNALSLLSSHTGAFKEAIDSYRKEENMFTTTELRSSLYCILKLIGADDADSVLLMPAKELIEVSELFYKELKMILVSEVIKN